MELEQNTLPLLVMELEKNIEGKVRDNVLPRR
jgi:hypothetical protein